MNNATFPLETRAARECAECGVYKQRHKPRCSKSREKQWFSENLKHCAKHLRENEDNVRDDRRGRMCWALGYLAALASDDAQTEFFAALDGDDQSAREAREWVRAKLSEECTEDPASCDCSWHQNARRAEASHEEPAK